MINGKKYLLTLLGLIILCLVLSCWVIWPTIKNIRENNQEIDYERQKLGKLLQQGQSVIENQKNLLLVQSEIKTLDKIWLKTGEELKFITDMEQAATASNLNQTINFDNTKLKGETEIKTIPIELQIEGNLNDIIAYINSLEELDYYINFTKININRSGNRDSKKFSKQIDDGSETEKELIQLSASLSGLTYWK